MSLTEKQNKYVLRMLAIRHQRKFGSGTDEEMRALYEASYDIATKNFGGTMRTLIFNLENLEKIQKKRLAPRVKELLVDLKQDYEF